MGGQAAGYAAADAVQVCLTNVKSYLLISENKPNMFAMCDSRC
jgi:hypothetical protein